MCKNLAIFNGVQGLTHTDQFCYCLLVSAVNVTDISTQDARRIRERESANFKAPLLNILSWVRIPERARDVLQNRTHWLWGPPRHLLKGYRSCLAGVKRSGRDVDHSPPPSAGVKNQWSHTSLPPTCLHGVVKDRFTFYLLSESLVLLRDKCVFFLRVYVCGLFSRV